MKPIHVLAAFAAGLLLTAGVPAHADSHTDASDFVESQEYVRVPGPGHLPLLVADSFYSRYPEGRITHIEKEEHGELIVYQLWTRDGDIRRNIMYKPDGTPILIDAIIPSSELPAPIAGTLAKQLPDGVVYRADKITRDGSTNFQVIVQTDSRNLELIMSQSGKVLSRKEVADYSAVMGEPMER